MDGQSVEDGKQETDTTQAYEKVGRSVERERGETGETGDAAGLVILAGRCTGGSSSLGHQEQHGQQ